MVKIALDPTPFHHSHGLMEFPRVAADLGYEWLQLTPHPDMIPFFNHPKADDDYVKAFKKACKDAGVGIASTLPVLRWSGPDEDAREAAVRYWKRVIRITAELGVDTIGTEFSGRPEKAEESERAFYRSMEEIVPLVEKEGIKVFIGQKADNVANAAVLVTSTAIKADNPEVVAALENRIPVVRRAEMLAELMRLKSTVAVAGTHGKTTTTSMIACLLDAGGIDPTVINGGIINSYGSNARLGDSDWMVVEADESDGSFLRLDGTIAVVTNIDPEHLDHYGDFDAVRKAFVDFVENIPFYGFAVCCIDHPEVQALIGQIEDRRILVLGGTGELLRRDEDAGHQVYIEEPVPRRYVSDPAADDGAQGRCQ